eukprot:m.7887 g.7887  ORF g.7887 m.7887 type:complete len:340 (-) comp4000_c0_seq1:64-1083(-)
MDGAAVVPSVDVGALAIRVLNEPDVPCKAVLTRELVEEISRAERSQLILPTEATRAALPSVPARPPSAKHSEFKNKGSSLKTTLHGIAHAEGYAVDLMWDLLARFTSTLPAADATEFALDWARIAHEEAVHFERWSALLRSVCGVAYGDLPTHSSLWEAATASADDLLCRLALVHLVHEARGLDTSSASLDRIVAYEQSSGHPANVGGPCADTLRRNVADEIGHVGCAVKWFERVCALRGIADPPLKFREIIQQRFRGELKPPFDLEKRAKANMSTAYFLWAATEPGTSDPAVAAKGHRKAVKALEREQRLLRKVVDAQVLRLSRVKGRLDRLHCDTSG